MKPDGTITFEIKAVSNLIRRRMWDLVSAPELGGLTGAQNAMLGYIMDHEEKQDLFQRDLEREFNIRRSTATVMLQSLEEKNFIRRVPVERDARLKKIVLTEKAVETQIKVRGYIEKFNRQLEQGLTEEERCMLLETLRKIKNNLKEEQCEK
ncbi:MAG: MarR family winged helix-turn-helix transcriptional regulator [Lachnospiraceae bacterium]|nr:MarR family winged helix-turn-helix transcriptional regulator [Lachnospiraceae bacterium]